MEEEDKGSLERGLSYGFDIVISLLTRGALYHSLWPHKRKSLASKIRNACDLLSPTIYHIATIDMRGAKDIAAISNQSQIQFTSSSL